MVKERKIGLVTGASKGIGAAIARQLASDGFEIWLNYRGDHGAAAQVAREIEADKGVCRLICFDVTDAEKTRAALEPHLAEATPFAVINNAGFARDALMVFMRREEWREVLSVSLDGFFNIMKMVLNPMIRKRRGRIVNLSSTSGQSGLPGQVNYSAAKAGLIGATKALAAEVAKREILVNAIAPGFIDTGMLDGVPVDRVLPMIPLGRLGLPEEVAALVSFLCSDRASYITGQVIGVNGGIYM